HRGSAIGGRDATANRNPVLKAVNEVVVDVNDGAGGNISGRGILGQQHDAADKDRGAVVFGDAATPQIVVVDVPGPRLAASNADDSYRIRAPGERAAQSE